MKPVFVEHDPHRKAMQRALIQYKNPNNYELVHEALELAHRTDLIGYDKKCLIRPRNLSDPAAKRAKAAAEKKPSRPLTEAEKKYGISFEKYDSMQKAQSQSRKNNSKNSGKKRKK